MKKIYTILFAVFAFIFTINVQAQEKTITGNVTSKSDGLPLPGVSIVVQGTARGTETDFDGNYSIKASEGEILNFSFIGMSTKSMTVGASNKINVALDEDANQLDEVVVTALGIKKSRKSLTYAAQDIKAEELTKVKDANPINSLSGKVSGVVINRSSSGVGGSVKVTLRGNTSTRDNQPLYVVDGIPLLNNSSIQPNSPFGDIGNAGNRDGGDALSLINPDDIESMTVLKGASASALYGSQGSNGVILITTKKGKSGSFRVNFSSNLTVDAAAYTVEFNERAQNNVDSFFRDGVTAINSISASGGTENAQTYFSYSNTQAAGLMPTHNVNKHSFNVRETAKLLNDKLTIDANVLLSTQKINNKPISGLYFNPLIGTYAFNSDTETLSDYQVFEQFDPNRNIMEQRWYRGTSDIEQNPYWILHRNASLEHNSKVLASLSLKYKINDWLSLQTRGSYDKSFYDFERRIYATTNATLAPTNGRYLKNDSEDTQIYGDIIATINTSLSEDYNLTANIGSSIRKSDLGVSTLLDSGVNGNLKVANIFTLSNIEVGTVGLNPVLSESQAERKEVQSIFFSSTLGYKEKLFLDLTARNDWSSTVSKPFSYYSAGVTAVLSEIFEMPESVSFSKFRVSYATVGNDISSFVNNPLNTIGTGAGGLTPPSIKPFSELTPEEQTSFEIGTEWKFFNNRLGFDLGYYKTNTIDQFMVIPGAGLVSPNGETADFFSVNAGDIENSGIEATIKGTPVTNDDFTWETSVNFASNNNKVIRLDERLGRDIIELTPFSVIAYGLVIKEGGSFGDIYGKEISRNDSGLPIRNSEGNFSQAEVNDDVDEGGLQFLGNANPDFSLGWNNSFTYKNLTLNFLIDGKFGGKAMSLTQAEADANGTSDRTGEIQIFDEATNSETSIPAAEYYQSIGGRSGLSGEYTYDATNVRLAELSLGYNFKLKEESFFNSFRASLIGRNLFFFHREAPYDPNVALSTGNGLQGVDIFGQPSTRSIGLNVSLSF